MNLPCQHFERTSKPTPEEALSRLFDRIFYPPNLLPVPRKIAVACSGGGDSLALLLLCKQWAEHCHFHHDKGHVATTITALICDHRQRAESAQECDALKRRIEDAFALEAQVFKPEFKTDVCTTHSSFSSYKGNLQHNMRLFRLQTMVGWCADNGVSFLALGHTRDDQLETHLLQEAGLTRGRGGMREMRNAQEAVQDGIPKREDEPTSQSEKIFLIRPLLCVSRAGLRAWLEARNVSWLEDPSNASMRYARNRMRRISTRLSQTEQARLLETCALAQRQEETAEQAMQHFSRAHVRWHEEGYACVDGDAFLTLERQVALKMLACLVRAAGGKNARKGQLLQVERAWRRCLTTFLAGGEGCDDKNTSKNTSKNTDRHECRQESNALSLGRCLLFARQRKFFVVRSGLDIAALPLTQALSHGALWDGRFCISSRISSCVSSRISSPQLSLPPSSSLAPSSAGWTCAALTREGVVRVRKFAKTAMAQSQRRTTTKNEKLERALALASASASALALASASALALGLALSRFEELPWRVREVLPSFWYDGRLCALPSLGIELESHLPQRLCSLYRVSNLPQPHFLPASREKIT